MIELLLLEEGSYTSLGKVAQGSVISGDVDVVGGLINTVDKPTDEELMRVYDGPVVVAVSTQQSADLATRYSEGDVVQAAFEDAYLFDPIKHPRNPENGKFVERPYPVPDEIADLGTEQVIGELAAANDNFGEMVEDIAVDVETDDDKPNVPTQIREFIDDPDAGSGGSIEDIQEIGSFSDIGAGDQVRVNGRLYDVNETKVSEGGLAGIEQKKIVAEPVGGRGRRSFNFDEKTIKTPGPSGRSAARFDGGGSDANGVAEVDRLVETEYGPKVKIDSPYEAKDAIKSLDFDETHRSWNSQSNTWDVDVDAVGRVIETLNDEGFTVSVTDDILKAAGVEKPG